jgi:hypothetical protein
VQHEVRAIGAVHDRGRHAGIVARAVDRRRNAGNVLLLLSSEIVVLAPPIESVIVLGTEVSGWLAP